MLGAFGHHVVVHRGHVGQEAVAEETVINQAGHQQGHADKAELKKAERRLAGLGQHGVDNAVGRRAHQRNRAAQGSCKSHGHKHLAGGQLGLEAHAHDHGHGHHGGAGVGQHGGKQAHRGHGVNQQLDGAAFGELHRQRAHLIRKAGDKGGLAHDEHGHEQHHRGIAEVAEGHFRGNDMGKREGDGHQQRGDGQRHYLGKEHDGRHEQNAQGDVGFCGIIRQLDAQLLGGEHVLPCQEHRHNHNHRQ